ncbi:MAG: hypothetical protein ACM3UZ_05085 [Acidobacteriota bacterium]
MRKLMIPLIMTLCMVMVGCADLKTPGKTAPTSVSGVKEPVSDQQRIKGTWLCVEATIDGQTTKMDPVSIKPENMLITTFDGESHMIANWGGIQKNLTYKWVGSDQIRADQPADADVKTPSWTYYKVGFDNTRLILTITQHSDDKSKIGERAVLIKYTPKMPGAK